MKVPELYSDIVNPHHVMCGADPRHGRYMAMSIMFRGKMSKVEVHEQVMNVSNRNSSYYIEWIPNNVKYSVVDVAPIDHDMTVTSLGNSTAIKSMFQRIIDQFSSMYKKKAFMHNYSKSEGIEGMEFVEAENNLNDLISQYQEYENAPVYSDDDDEYDDEEVME